MTYSKNLRGAVVIPARWQSSRLPGKPLELIGDKPMVQHVYERCVLACGAPRVYVATDSLRIKEVVESFDGQVVMTPSECLTGTDRLAQANRVLGAEFIINVQGDEPMVDPDAIADVWATMVSGEVNVVNCYAPLSLDRAENASVPKVVVSSGGRLLYMSRSPIPGSKSGLSSGAFFKQVCIYGFTKAHLEFFEANPQKTPLEKSEDIEILRFLENDVDVKMIRVRDSGYAVDTPADLAMVRSLMCPIETQDS